MSYGRQPGRQMESHMPLTRETKRATQPADVVVDPRLIGEVDPGMPSPLGGNAACEATHCTPSLPRPLQRLVEALPRRAPTHRDGLNIFMPFMLPLCIIQSARARAYPTKRCFDTRGYKWPCDYYGEGWLGRVPTNICQTQHGWAQIKQYLNETLAAVVEIQSNFARSNSTESTQDKSTSNKLCSNPTTFGRTPNS